MEKSFKQRYANLRPALEAGGVKLVAILVGLMSAINLVSSATPALQRRLLLIEDALPMEVRQGSRLAAALAGFALFLLAGSLWRRKRNAWILTIALLILSSILHMIKGLDYEEAGFALALLIPLLLLRRSYQAFSDPPSVRHGLVVLGAAFGFTLLYGTIGFYLLDRRLDANFNLLAILQRIFSMFTSLSNPGQLGLTGFGGYIVDSIYVIGIVTIGYALVMVIRPVLSGGPVTESEREQVKEIINRFGKTSLCGLNLLKDKSYFFSPGGSVISYAVRGRGAVSLGDPIGRDEDTLEAITAFKSHCYQHDWCPAFVAVLPDHLDAYRKAGFDILPIGCEAILPVKGFSLEGNKNKDMRVPYNKLVRLGYEAVFYPPPLADSTLGQLRIVSEDWLATQPGGEDRFSIGWFEDDYVRNSPIMAVHSPGGSITAFANILYEGSKNEVTIDLMRRQTHVPNGTMEFLFISILKWAREQNIDGFSLGTCVAVETGDLQGDARLTKTIFKIAETLNRFYNFQGLYEFKKKFQPDWQPRYLVYPGVANLPLVLTTVIRVHKGENLMTWFSKNEVPKKARA